MKISFYKLAMVCLIILVTVAVFALPVSASHNFTPSVPGSNAFAPSDPTFTSIVPNSGSQGQVLTVTLTGWYMNDANAVTFSGTGVTASSLVVLNSQQITCIVTIASTAAPGLRNITITYNSESPMTVNNVFTVIATPPVINSVNPNSGLTGQPLNVIISGVNFAGPVTVNFSGTGITVNNVIVNNATQLAVAITVFNDCLPGQRNVTVNAAGGSSTLNNCFTVNMPQALLTTVNPNQHGSSVSTGTQSPVSLSSITVSTASLSASKVAPGTPVTVSASAVNRSTVNGSTRLTVYVNGQEESSQGVAVNSGSSTPVTFTVTRNEPGMYTIYVGGTNAGSFVVDEFTDPNIILYISIAFVSAAFLAGLVLLGRRRQAGR